MREQKDATVTPDTVVATGGSPRGRTTPQVLERVLRQTRFMRRRKRAVKIMEALGLEPSSTLERNPQ